MGMHKLVNSANLSQIASCLAYAAASISMVIVNKAISLAAVQVNTGDYLFIAIQCFVATLLMEIARRFGKVAYDVNLSMVLNWLPVNLAFTFMLLTSFMSMKFCSVPAITVFKNLTNVLIVFGDWHFNSQPVSFLILTSLAVMCGGAVLAAMNDIEFSITGYIWMGLNCFATAYYVLVMKYATKSMKLERAGMVFLNNFSRFVASFPIEDLGANRNTYTFIDVHTKFGVPHLSCIMLLLLSIGYGEVTSLFKGGQMELSLFCLILFSGALGVFLSFATLWCVGSTSATTYAVVGTLNKVPTTILGVLIFHSTITVSGAFYIAVVMMGGFLYSWAKIQENSPIEKERSNSDDDKKTRRDSDDSDVLLTSSNGERSKTRSHNV